jgi:hypothetical protein
VSNTYCACCRLDIAGNHQDGCPCNAPRVLYTLPRKMQPIPAWRCECGAIMAFWLDTCYACWASAPERTVSGEDIEQDVHVDMPPLRHYSVKVRITDVKPGIPKEESDE